MSVIDELLAQHRKLVRQALVTPDPAEKKRMNTEAEALLKQIKEFCSTGDGELVEESHRSADDPLATLPRN